jgi:N6-adenosine-specific RNA methylase IME4
MECHEASSLFPLMSDDEYRALVDDIRVNGLREPIVIAEGKVLDGRNRLRACEELGIVPRTRMFSRTVDGSLVDYVVSLNLHRRHLTPSQAAAVAFSLEPWYASEAKRRQVDLAGTRPNINPDLGTGSVPRSRTPRSAQVAAKTVGASRSGLESVRQIAQTAPELVGQMRDGTMTLTDAKKQIRRAERVEAIAEQTHEPTPLESITERFPVIYADPPWKYEHAMDDGDSIEQHYPTLSLDEIAEMPISDLATRDCVLFLWATNPKLKEAMQVIDRWGFSYRTNMCWDKEWIGPGYYVRQRHELLLIATRGNPPVPTTDNRPPSVYREKRTEHSKKPEQFYCFIEAMYPDFPKIELFARGKARVGWTIWGNQTER